MPLTTTHSKWRGAEAIKLQPTYPRFKRTAKGATLTLVFRGPYVDLRTYGPDIGDSITLSAFDYAPGAELVYAESVECQPDGAGEDGPGTLTIVYSNETSGFVVITSGEPDSTTYEIESTTLEKRLETHPRYNGGTGPYSAFGMNVEFQMNTTGETISVAEFWDRFKGASSQGRKDLRGEIPPDAGALLELIDELAVKFFRGQESYVVCAPIARKTSRSYAMPSVGGVGNLGDPSGFTGLPSGYQWLKTGDRGVRQGRRGKWERVEEWTGAKEWDIDLY
ncbi:MAG: hypothetical protein HZA93_23950 [Verrucomicrobia bacterium]|nr:hypothetical protein [Verrucomicrobiota bacterium]